MFKAEIIMRRHSIVIDIVEANNLEAAYEYASAVAQGHEVHRGAKEWVDVSHEAGYDYVRVWEEVELVPIAGLVHDAPDITYPIERTLRGVGNYLDQDRVLEILTLETEEQTYWMLNNVNDFDPAGYVSSKGQEALMESYLERQGIEDSPVFMIVSTVGLTREDKYALMYTRALREEVPEPPALTRAHDPSHSAVHFNRIAEEDK